MIMQSQTYIQMRKRNSSNLIILFNDFKVFRIEYLTAIHFCVIDDGSVFTQLIGSEIRCSMSCTVFSQHCHKQTFSPYLMWIKAIAVIRLYNTIKLADINFKMFGT